MPATIVLQSHRSPLPYQWLKSCINSVKSWSDNNQYDYRFMGDELFNVLPDIILQKTQKQKVIATDLARLLHLQNALDEGYHTVIWMDADFLIFKPQVFVLPQANYALGREVWIQHDKHGKLRAYKKVHNAFMMFRRGNTFLDFYAETANRLLMLNTGSMPAQFIGPKLLTALHNITHCPVMESAGMLSPVLIKAILNNEKDPVAVFNQHSLEPVCAANLCSSSYEKNELCADEMESLVEVLLSRRVEI